METSITNITDVSKYTLTGEFDIVGSFRPDAGSIESKTVTLRFIMNRVPLIDAITSSLKDKKIAWVGGPGRTRYNVWKDRSVIRVDYKAPAKRVVTREERIETTANTFMKSGIKIDGQTMTREQAVEFATTAVDEM